MAEENWLEGESLLYSMYCVLCIIQVAGGDFINLVWNMYAIFGCYLFPSHALHLKRTRAATIIQSSYRGYTAQIRYQKLKLAILTIQV